MPRRESALRLPLIGLTFVVLLAGAVVLAIVDYSGGFVSRDEVTLYAGQSGNQLSPGAQVKLHGVVVGSVESLGVRGKDAEITLGLDPKYRHLIPENVKARILPKTLIGQDYIDLVAPRLPSTQPIEAGDVISRDDSSTAIELETALNNLLVTLNDVPPQKLAVTLNAVSSAFQGRGREFGETLSSLQRYLHGLEPSMPRLVEDIRAVAKTSDTYDQAAPELIDALHSFSTTAKTVVAQRAHIESLYRDVTHAADQSTAFLDANGENIIRVAATSRRTLQILARYAPEYPCLLKQLNGLVPRVDAAFGAGTKDPALNVTLQVSVSRGKYRPGVDAPKYADRRGPRCYPIMRLAPQYPDGSPIKDGSTAPIGAPGADRIAAPSAGGSAAGASSTGQDRTSAGSLANSDTESDLISGLFASGGKPAPSFSSLLLGPILRGSEVTVR